MAKKLKDFTKYPKLFNNTWGNQPESAYDSSIIATRNAFVETFVLVKSVAVPKFVNDALTKKSPAANGGKALDNLELYDMKDKRILLVSSADASNCSWEEMNAVAIEVYRMLPHDPLYNGGYNTYIRTFKSVDYLNKFIEVMHYENDAKMGWKPL